MSTSGELEVNMSQFSWKINNFRKLCKNNGDVTYSPIIQIGGPHEFRWRLQLYPFGSPQNEGYISIFLESMSQTVRVKVFFEFVLSDIHGSEIKKKKALDQFDSKSFSWGWNKFIERNFLLQKIEKLDDQVNITCTIKMDVYNVKEVEIGRKILDNYESLFCDENLSDVTISINGKLIEAHKAILSARSQVFEAMFKHNMKESNTHVVKIADVSYNTMKELLRFIYSGKVMNLKKHASTLLPAADKYGITELKVICEKSIWKNIKIENACEFLEIASLYNCSDLKALIIEYIIAHIKEVNKTNGFKNLNRNDPGLFEDIFTQVVDRKC